MNNVESRRLANSQTISQVVTGLIVALAAFLAFALDKRELGAIFWVPVALGATLLVISMILGGRGIARISDPKGLFNLQALACLFGFLLLGGSLFALGKPLESKTTSAIASISERVGELRERVGTLEASSQLNRRYIDDNQSSISGLKKEITNLKEHISQLYKIHNPKDKSDSVGDTQAQQQPPLDARSSRH